MTADSATPKQRSALPPRRALRYAKQRFGVQLAIAAGKEPVLVYQMGKVGSSALAQLIDRVPGCFAVQVHRLAPARRTEIQNRFDAGEHYYKDMRFEGWIHDWLQNRSAPTKIVTAVREPMSHSYSSFFQNLRRSTRGKMQAATPGSINDLSKLFLEWEELGAALTWLDLEMSPLIGSDLLAHPFDQATGWSVSTGQEYTVLTLKSEIGDDVKRTALTALLGHDPGEVSRQNSAVHKDYAATYRSFIDAVKIPAPVAAQWMQHRYTQTFYSAVEREAAVALYAGPDRQGARL